MCIGGIMQDKKCSFILPLTAFWRYIQFTITEGLFYEPKRWADYTKKILKSKDYLLKAFKPPGPI
jgi:hypothetical protein